MPIQEGLVMAEGTENLYKPVLSTRGRADYLVAGITIEKYWE